jgi:hypothetical protein
MHGPRGVRIGTETASRTIRSLSVCVILLTACSDGGGEAGSSASSSTGASDATTSPAPSETSSPLPEPTLQMKRFEMPSGNILCESFAESLVCVIDSGLVPEPSHDFCPVDWIGLFIQTGQYSGPSCSGDPGIDRAPAPRFDYTRMWSRAGVTCHSAKSGLTCEDGSGNGFTLASAGWTLLGKEGAATEAFSQLRKLVRKEARTDYGADPEAVPRPTLRGGDDCGGLQQAFVDVNVNVDVPNAIYEACFVSGTWHVTDGPLIPD